MGLAYVGRSEQRQRQQQQKHVKQQAASSKQQAASSEQRAAAKADTLIFGLRTYQTLGF